MHVYLLRRVLLMLPTAVLVSVFVFVLIRAIPGDVVTVMLADSKDADEAQELRTKLGLDRPMAVQYWIWLQNGLRGDLGQSLWTRNTVIGEIGRALPITVELSVLAMFIATLLAIPAGLVSAVARNHLPDYAVRMVSILGLSIPAFWLGTLYIMLPAIWFRWTPPIDYVPFVQDPVGNLRQFILPALSVGYYLSAITMRMVRSQTLEVLQQDFIRTARAKGLGARAVIVRHALRNALIPAISVIGAQTGVLLGGVVIIEQIFVLPGLGRLTLWAIQVRDYPQLQANILVIVLMTMLVNLVTDLCYGWLDPRVKLAGASG
ncbi:MAG TPA: ABC transporter permease [Candidatus Methylomirabilis sp.]|nr:ABC transporter permease [Candidatus Methylomirabilis sp.]